MRFRGFEFERGGERKRKQERREKAREQNLGIRHLRLLPESLTGASKQISSLLKLLCELITRA